MQLLNAWTLILGEISAWVTWLNNWQLFGVSFLFYCMAFAIIGLLMDFIFG